MILTNNKKRPPFLTVIIATLNVEDQIQHCIESIVHQTAIDKIEILVKDGGSTDRTLQILDDYNTYIDYRESFQDSGIYAAWNSVLPKATGDWVIFLGADDVFIDNSIVSRLSSRLKNTASSIDLVYGKVRLVNSQNEKILDAGMNWENSRKCIYEKMCIPHQGILHRNTLFKRFGYFSTDYIISSDYEYLRRVIDTSNVLYLNMVISCMGMGGISSNQNFTFVRLREIRDINKIYGSKIPGIRWLMTYFNACMRYGLFKMIGEKKSKYILDQFRKMAGRPELWTKF